MCIISGIILGVLTSLLYTYNTVIPPSVLDHIPPLNSSSVLDHIPPSPSVLDHIPPSPSVLEQYAQCLKNKVYSRIHSTIDDDKLPQGKETIYISLAAVKLGPLPKKEVDELAEITLHGGVDEISNIKEQIDMNDVLKPVSNEHLKFVLVEGAPGIGKTTFVKEFVRQWLSRSVDYLRDISLVIRITLREKKFREAKSLNDLYLEEPCDAIINMTELKRFINASFGANVLWILDGFDELPAWQRDEDSIYVRLITKLLPDATVLVTSRPIASRNLLPYIKALNVAKRIEIVGFNSTTIDAYVREYFKDQNDTYVNFTRYYKSNPVMENMMYIPLNCYILCMIYEDKYDNNNKPVPSTMTEIYDALVQSLIRRQIYSDNNSKIDMPERLMCKEDFVSSGNFYLKDAFGKFFELTKKAFDGIKEQKYIFDDDVSSINLGLMSSILSINSPQRDQYTSHFLHTTLQEYMAAVYIASENSVDILFNNTPIRQHYIVVAIFYVGIAEKLNLTLNHKQLAYHIFTPGVSDCDILLRCLYESPKLASLYSLNSNGLTNCLLDTPLDCYIVGYLISHYNVSFKVTLKKKVISNNNIDYFMQGFQAEPSHNGGGIFDVTVHSTDINLLLKLPSRIHQLTLTKCVDQDFIYKMTLHFTKIQQLRLSCINCTESCGHLMKLNHLTSLYIETDGESKELVSLMEITKPGSTIHTLYIAKDSYDDWPQYDDLYFFFYPSSIETLYLYGFGSSDENQCSEMNSTLLSLNDNLKSFEIELSFPCFNIILQSLIHLKLTSITFFSLRAFLYIRNTYFNAIASLLKSPSTIKEVILYFNIYKDIDDIINSAEHNPNINTVKLCDNLGNYTYANKYDKVQVSTCKKVKKSFRLYT